MLSAWRGFYAYLMRDHGLTDNPCVGLRAPRSPKALPQALSPDEAARLVDLPADTTNQSATRRCSNCFTLPACAWRAGRPRPAQLDLSAGEVRVTGKGSKTRIVPLASRGHRAASLACGARPAGPRRRDRAGLSACAAAASRRAWCNCA